MNQIAPRNRQIVNGAVRRLGFAPIPSRRSNFMRKSDAALMAAVERHFVTIN